MSDTASFVDPVFLARFGLARWNALDYFLHPLNPFRTNTNTSNEVLSMQGIGIGTLMQMGTGVKAGPLTPQTAEEEYGLLLSRMVGEQYELLPPPPPPASSAGGVAAGDDPWNQPQNLFVIRHVLRSNPSTVKVLGIYYILEGVIYKSPSVRSLMKANVTRTVECLSEACDALSTSARYEPSTGYYFNFEDESSDEDEEEDDDDHGDETTNKKKKTKKRSAKSSGAVVLERKRIRRILDNRPPGQRTQEEEEGIRATEAIDGILTRLSKR